MSKSNPPLVSVLIPIYKTERFIERCISSVINQDYRPLEIVLVDDCGGDNAMNIACSMIEKQDIQLKKIYHKVNEGLSAARKHSLEASTGDFIMFLDSDDYWDAPDNVSNLLHQFHLYPQIDCVVADYFADYPNKIVYMKVNCPSNPKDAAKSILRGKMPAFLWNKIFRRSAFLRYAGDFIPGVRLWEDVRSVVPFFARGGKVLYYPYAFLHYEQSNCNSLVHTMSYLTLNELNSAIDYCANIILDIDEYDQDINIAYLNAKCFVLLNVPLSDYPKVLPVHAEVDCLNARREVSYYRKVIFNLQRNRFTAWLGYLSVKAMDIWKYILRY